MPRTNPTMKSIVVRIVAVALFPVIFAIVAPGPGHGGETAFPMPSYQRAELAKLREWEKGWVGKRIDAPNVDQVADYIPEMYRESIKNPEKWGGKPMWFKIVPYRQVIPTRGFTEATRKNAEKVKMDERMVPVGYEDISGFPFPEPKTGWEVAWNYDFNNRGDFIYFRQEGVQVDTTTGLESTSIARIRHLWFVSRTEVPPKPRIPDKDNPRGLRWAFLREYEHPRVISKNRGINYRYLNFDKEDESYTWLSEFKRIVKSVATQKGNTQYGRHRSVEDQDGFSNHMIANEYKLLGRKELLVARHVDFNEWVRVPGQYLWSGVERERVNTYVVEVTSKDPTHVYSKRIWYVDPEDFFMKWVECYDREGKLWRVLENQYGVYKNANGEEVSFLVGTADLDQKEMGAAAHVKKPLSISGSSDPSLYTLRGLRRGAY